MSIIVNIAGDLSTSHFKSESFHLCDEIARFFKESDINIVNLENPVLRSDLTAKPKPIALKSEMLSDSILNTFDYFSLANNHSFDFYEEGFFQTQEYLNNKGKQYFGAGINLKDAIKPLIISRNGIKLAVWGVTRFDNAKRKKPGTAPDHIKHYKKEIIKYKSDGFFILFYAHWGREYIDYPTPDDRTFAKNLINLGADCVIGTHPHVPQGFEPYKGKFIFYSLGNFVFSSEVAEYCAFEKEDIRLGLGYVVQLRINDDLTYSPLIIPYKTVDGTISSLKGNDLEDFKSNLERISFETVNDRLHLSKFYSSASEIRKQSKRMIRKQFSKGGVKSLIDPIKNVRLQDLRIAFYPNLEKRFPVLSKENIAARMYSVFVHKFLTFSIIGVLVTLITMISLGVLLGVIKLPLFPTWWIVYLSSIGLSFFLNNKLIFKDDISVKKIFLFIIVYLSSMFLGIYLIKFFRMITDLPNWLLGYVALPFTLTYNFYFVNKVLSDRLSKEKELNLKEFSKLYDTIFLSK
jgi:putative flippase GtrA